MAREIKIESAGAAVRTLRQNANMSIGELASRIGCDKGQLSRYENDRLGLSLPVIERIAVALGKAPLAVVLACLQERYPDLKRSDFKPARILKQLLAEQE